MIDLRAQTFGVEIEMAGITRKKAARVIAGYFGTEPGYCGGNYDAYIAKDTKGRTWKAVSDSSIRAEAAYRTEVVTPILRYDDIEDLQEILRKLRRAGAKVNESTGIHIHIGAENFIKIMLISNNPLQPSEKHKKQRGYSLQSHKGKGQQSKILQENQSEAD